jgi:hypothetical protein
VTLPILLLRSFSLISSGFDTDFRYDIVSVSSVCNLFSNTAQIRAVHDLARTLSQCGCGSLRYHCVRAAGIGRVPRTQFLFLAALVEAG